MCQKENMSFGNSLTVESCYDRPSSSMSSKSESRVKRRRNNSFTNRTTRPSSALGIEKADDLKHNDTSGSLLFQNARTKCESTAEINKTDYELVLTGSTMSPFFNIWSRKERKVPLGRGKTELPNSFLRQDKYRQCGCETRHHKTVCRKSECCSA